MVVPPADQFYQKGFNSKLAWQVTRITISSTGELELFFN